MDTIIRLTAWATPRVVTSIVRIQRGPLGTRLNEALHEYVVQAWRDHPASDSMGSTRVGIAAEQTACLGVSPFSLWTMGLRS